VVVIGGSGTGKSVLLKWHPRHPAGGLRYDPVDGEDVTQTPAADRDTVNRKFGMLFQGAALFDSLPVWENVSFGLIQRERIGRAEARDRAVATLAKSA